LLDGDRDIDPAVQRLRMIDRICEGFSCLPLQAERELDNDPEHLALQILDMREYIAAKVAWDRAKDKVADLAAWEGSPHMTLVELNTLDLHLERIAQSE
jgi:hypothetical protein